MNYMYFVYILTNTYHTVLYIGVTNNLKIRVYEHREKIVEGFSDTYELWKLVYFEVHTDVNLALIREKRLKKWKREWKENLINQKNPEWNDLYDIL